jgi:nitrogen regulatory protein PII
MDTVKAALITCSVYQPVTGRALMALRAVGVKEYYIQSSRAVVLRRKSGLLGIGGGIGLEEEPADRIFLHVPASEGEIALRALTAACDLNVPGRGSAIWEDVDIVRSSAWEAHALMPIEKAADVDIQDGLGYLTCIVQHGRGNNIVSAILGLGVPMPLVTTGEGTGLRDKLGLIRVALPASKEVVHAIVSAHEVVEILNSVADAGRLDRIGSGFIYESPVRSGAINNMVIRGQRHSASIEQLIEAVDDLKGSTNWRKRALGGDGAVRERSYMHDLVNVTLICNEGFASDLVHAAMAAGAGGATIINLMHARTDEASSPVSAARQMTELIVKREAVEAIVEALTVAGAFEEATAGVISLRPVNLASTH